MDELVAKNIETVEVDTGEGVGVSGAGVRTNARRHPESAAEDEAG